MHAPLGVFLRPSRMGTAKIGFGDQDLHGVSIP
jgi:hypothetical protein